MSKWRQYQIEVAEFFRALGLSASVDETVEGVRTKHDIDVLVVSRHAGIEVVWLVECKDWKTRVPKEKVLAFREIVKDVGADRGFFMAESGYQSGALEAARYTNIQLTSLGELRTSLADELGLQSLRSMTARVELCRQRYWSIGKYDRIALGLRHPVGVPGYSGRVVLDAVAFTLRQALLTGFPISYDRRLSALAAMGDGIAPVGHVSGIICATPDELLAVLAAELGALEDKLDHAEAELAEGKGASATLEPEGG